MKTQEVSGTVVGGELQLDGPLDFPDHSRVRVMIEAAPSELFDWDAAMEAFKRLRQRHPIHSGGRRYTREELHERR